MLANGAKLDAIIRRRRKDTASRAVASLLLAGRMRCYSRARACDGRRTNRRGTALSYSAKRWCASSLCYHLDHGRCSDLRRSRGCQRRRLPNGVCPRGQPVPRCGLIVGGLDIADIDTVRFDLTCRASRLPLAGMHEGLYESLLTERLSLLGRSP